MSATSRVLLGLVGAAAIGLVLTWVDPALAISVADGVSPIGRLWLNALQMTVVPLVLSLVVISITAASDAAASGRTARHAMWVFFVLLVAAAAFAAIVAPALLALLPPDPALTAALSSAEASDATQVAPTGWGDRLVALIPSNAVAAAAQAAMLPLVVFSLFFGFALTRIERDRRTRVVEFLQAIADAMIVIVNWVLWVAPIGVFALVLEVTARAGLSVLGALGIYILLLCVMYLATAVAMIPVALVWGSEKFGRFVRAIAPAQAIAASTQSSLATLPAMLEIAQNRLHYSPQVASLVLPMAVSLFRITSPVHYLTAAAFIAWAYGIDLTGAQMAVAAALAVVVSLGSVGLPGTVSFMATNLPVTQALGLPVAPLALLMAVDTIPDVFATVGNVTADMTAVSIVSRKSNSANEASEPTAADSPD